MLGYFGTLVDGYLLIIILIHSMTSHPVFILYLFEQFGHLFLE